jgi:hypothetical protein
VNDFKPPADDTVTPLIQTALTHLSEQDERAFRKKFEEQWHHPEQYQHTFAELLTGVFVRGLGYRPGYERLVNGETPEWYFEGAGGRRDFIGEVVTSHAPKALEEEQNRSLQQKGSWGGWPGSGANRFYEWVQRKAGKYKDLVEKLGVPYVVFCSTLAGPGGYFFGPMIYKEEIEDALGSPEYGLFHAYPTLSGVYHVYWERGGFNFDYYTNLACSKHAALKLPSGVLPAMIEPFAGERNA